MVSSCGVDLLWPCEQDITSKVRCRTPNLITELVSCILLRPFAASPGSLRLLIVPVSAFRMLMVGNYFLPIKHSKNALSLGDSVSYIL